MTTTSTTPTPQSSVIWDALPYVDAVQDDYEQYATALIQEELDQSRNRHTVPELKPVTRSAALAQAIEDRGQETEANDTTICNFSSRYDLKRPPDKAPAAEWKRAVRRLRTAYEVERQRSLALQVLKPETNQVIRQHKNHSSAMAGFLSQDQEVLASKRHETDAINRQRLESQQLIHDKQLHRLELQYHQLVQKQVHLRTAVQELEKELQLDPVQQ